MSTALARVSRRLALKGKSAPSQSSDYVFPSPSRKRQRKEQDVASSPQEDEVIDGTKDTKQKDTRKKGPASTSKVSRSQTPKKRKTEAKVKTQDEQVFSQVCVNVPVAHVTRPNWRSLCKGLTLRITQASKLSDYQVHGSWEDIAEVKHRIEQYREETATSPAKRTTPKKRMIVTPFSCNIITPTKSSQRSSLVKCQVADDKVSDTNEEDDNSDKESIVSAIEHSTEEERTVASYSLFKSVADSSSGHNNDSTDQKTVSKSNESTMKTLATVASKLPPLGWTLCTRTLEEEGEDVNVKLIHVNSKGETVAKDVLIPSAALKMMPEVTKVMEAKSENNSTQNQSKQSALVMDIEIKREKDCPEKKASSVMSNSKVESEEKPRMSARRKESRPVNPDSLDSGMKARLAQQKAPLEKYTRRAQNQRLTLTDPNKATHTCSLCGYSSSAVGIKRHLQRRHSSNVYTCDICGTNFGIKYDCGRHRLVHFNKSTGRLTPKGLKLLLSFRPDASPSSFHRNDVNTVQEACAEDHHYTTEDVEPLPLRDVMAEMITSAKRVMDAATAGGESEKLTAAGETPPGSVVRSGHEDVMTAADSGGVAAVSTTKGREKTGIQHSVKAGRSNENVMDSSKPIDAPIKQEKMDSAFEDIVIQGTRGEQKLSTEDAQSDSRDQATGNERVMNSHQKNNKETSEEAGDNDTTQKHNQRKVDETMESRSETEDIDQAKEHASKSPAVMKDGEVPKEDVVKSSKSAKKSSIDKVRLSEEDVVDADKVSQEDFMDIDEESQGGIVDIDKVSQEDVVDNDKGSQGDIVDDEKVSHEDVVNDTKVLQEDTVDGDTVLGDDSEAKDKASEEDVADSNIFSPEDIVANDTMAECGDCGFQALYGDVLKHMQQGNDRMIHCDICGEQWRNGTCAVLARHREVHFDDEYKLTPEAVVLLNGFNPSKDPDSLKLKPEHRSTDWQKSRKNGLLRCVQCCFQANSVSAMNIHKLIHAHPAWQCASCLQIYPHRYEAQAHTCSVNDTAAAIEVLLLCSQCDMVQPSMAALCAHFSQYHLPRSYCALCKASLENEAAVHRHFLSQHHMDIKQNSTESEGVAWCMLCSKQVKEKELNKHLNDHRTATKRFTCKHCPFTSSQQAVIRQHIRQRHKEPQNTSLGCMRCDKYFNDQRGLRYHLLSVHGHGEGIACEECERVFATESRKQAHVARVHRQEKHFVCGVCNKRFFVHARLLQHMETHADKDEKELLKRYMCHFCEQGFRDPQHLKFHENIHLGRKPYKCKVCSKGFHSTAAVHKHQKSHSDVRPFKCQSCPKAFKFRNKLTAHTVTHSKISKHNCRICGKVFTCASTLKTHSCRGLLLQHHQQQQQQQMQKMVQLVMEKQPPPLQQQQQQQQQQQMITQLGLEKMDAMENSDVIYMCALCQHLAQSHDEISQHVAICHSEEEPAATAAAELNEGDVMIDPNTPGDVMSEESAPGDIRVEHHSIGDVMVEHHSIGDVMVEHHSTGDVMIDQSAPGDVMMEHHSAGDVIDQRQLVVVESAAEGFDNGSRTVAGSSNSSSNQGVHYVVSSTANQTMTSPHHQFVQLLQKGSESGEIECVLDSSQIVKYITSSSGQQLIELRCEEEDEHSNEVEEHKEEVVQYIIENAEGGDGDSVLMVMESEGEDREGDSIKVEAIDKEESELLNSQEMEKEIEKAQKTEADTLEAASVLTGMGQEGAMSS